MEEPEARTAAMKCLVPLLFNVYTNDQPLPTDCSRFLFADDLCITTQQGDFQNVEHTLELALHEMFIYYSRNHIKPDSANTQICYFRGTETPNHTEPKFAFQAARS